MSHFDIALLHSILRFHTSERENKFIKKNEIFSHSQIDLVEYLFSKQKIRSMKTDHQLMYNQEMSKNRDISHCQDSVSLSKPKLSWWTKKSYPMFDR